MAEDAGTVGVGERHYDELTNLDAANVGADVLDDADRLVAHVAPRVAGLHCLVRPEVAAADRGARDADQRVGRFDQSRVGDVLDPNVAGAVHDSCTHVQAASMPLPASPRR